MQVILREDVDNLGKAGDIVSVKDGFGRNFLLPRGLAYPATDSNKKRVAAEARHYAARAPMAAQMIKRSVNAISGALDRSIMHMDFDQHLLASRSEDSAEAISAYRGKRKATFKGN